jgi:DNA polymerase III subunit epsilon
MNFVAIDFETANERRTSPCAVGLAVVKNGIVSERFAKLIRPAEFRFSPRNVAIHGIRPHDVEQEPEFPDVWQAIQPYIDGGTVLAHSASFDVSVLAATLEYYHIPEPEFRYLCTVQVAKAVWPTIGSYTLISIATMLGIAVDHHHASDDASACAEIATRACARTGCKSIDELADCLGIAFGDSRHKCRSDRNGQTRGHWHHERKATEFVPQSVDFDPAHPLFGRFVAFTGPLVSMPRSEAMQCVADVGGQPADSVTKKTDFLVVGGRYFDVFSHKTTKLKKATEMIANGSPLDIIGEDDFLNMLAE